MLTSKAVLGECDYETEVRKRLVPLVRASAINRFLMNRVGNRGFKMVANHWMRDQRRKGDGLAFMRWMYKPGLLRRLLWPVVRLGMLRRKELADGRMVSRMPFRKSLSRDIWEQSVRAEEIGNEWDQVRKGGGRSSFGESDA